MIRKIDKVNNLGRFEGFVGTREFEKNSILFGFNGAGKSTLSDVFYSLAHIGSDDLIIDRKTMRREGEEEDKIISINIVSGDGECYSFNNVGWDKRPHNLFVFNEKYIEDHVFVSKHVEGDTIPIGLGKEGTKLMRQKEVLVHTQTDLINGVNQDIQVLSDAGIKITDFSKSKVSEKTPITRFEKMASFELYSLGEESKIREKQKRNVQYSQDLELLDRCESMYKTIEAVEKFAVGDAFKTIHKIPRITSKDITSFIEKHMTTSDIKWAVRGYINQKNKSICPMCGQSISDKQAIIFFRKLGKYISQNKNEAIQAFSKKLSSVASKLEWLRIDVKIPVFAEIISLLENNGLLIKKEKDYMQKGMSWSTDDSLTVKQIIDKIHYKADNPYLEVSLSQKEVDTIKLLNSAVSNIIALRSILQNIRERVEKKIDRKMRQDEVGKRLELSYGGNGSFRILAEDMKSKALTYKRNVESIKLLTQKIDDCYNQNRINEVNSVLQDLNTHIVIEVKNSQYFVRLRDFLPRKIDEKETIFSEGERRAIAFAYFLTEISYVENGDQTRTIVIDDPISSMDLSRKSIISHRVSEMMNREEWQIILMTHDIGFVERVLSYIDKNVGCDLLEIRAEKNDFVPLVLEDYLTDDKTVYRNFICRGENNGREVDKIIALMSLRPFAYVNNVKEEDYKKVEKMSTYFAHTLYAKSGRITYKSKDYCSKRLKTLIRLVNKATKSKFDVDNLIGDYSFSGFDFESISRLYLSIPIDSMDNMRKKVMLMRPLIEACFFQFSSREKFDPEHIGSIYKSTIRSNSNDPMRRKICEELLELYNASKKYHHGAEDGSLLGISWINPNEVEFFDNKITGIVNQIIGNNMIRQLSA